MKLFTLEAETIQFGKKKMLINTDKIAYFVELEQNATQIVFDNKNELIVNMPINILIDIIKKNEPIAKGQDVRL